MCALALCAAVRALPHTFTDDMRRTVTVTSPRRVAVLQGSLADIWRLAGGTVAAATEDAFTGPAGIPASASTVNIGGMISPSTELILASGADFVVLSADVASHRKLEPFLKGAGIPAAYFSVETFPDYLRTLSVCCAITGRADLYERNGALVQERIRNILSSMKRPQDAHPRVLLLRAFTGGVEARDSSSMAGVMLKELGCENIADGAQWRPKEISMEKIIEEEPDFIFAITMGASDSRAMMALHDNLTSRPAWKSLKAVQDGHFFVLPRELFHYKPNARWDKAYAELAGLLYGE